MDFSEALTAVKAGSKIQREGWNGKGLWVELQRFAYTDTMVITRALDYLTLSYPPCDTYPSGAVVPWLASQTDILASDWTVLP